jgi:hypothetical protein
MRALAVLAVCGTTLAHAGVLGVSILISDAFCGQNSFYIVRLVLQPSMPLSASIQHTMYCRHSLGCDRALPLQNLTFWHSWSVSVS